MLRITPRSKPDFFNIIYQAAKKKDKAALAKLFGIAFDDGRQLYFNDTVCEAFTAPVIRLAEEGDVNAVEFLISLRPNVENDAIEGFARGRHHAQVKKRLDVKRNINRVLFAYACTGWHAGVTDLLAMGGAVVSAVSGYARGGFFTEMRGLLRQHPQLINIAVYHLAYSGHIEELNHQLAAGAKVKEALSGFSNAGYFNDNNRSKLVRALVMLEHNDMRVQMFRRIKMPRPSLAQYNLLSEIKKLQWIMQKRKLSYAQAIAWNSLTERIWILQCIPHLRARLPMDVLAIITLYICSDFPMGGNELRNLYERMHFQINKELIAGSLRRYADSFFSPLNARKRRANSLAKACEQAESRWEILTLVKYQRDLFHGVAKAAANSKRPAHEQPFGDSKRDEFNEIVDRNCIRLSK